MPAEKVKVGENGELASRLLLLLCKDAIHCEALEDRGDMLALADFDRPLLFCDQITLLKFLKTLLGDKIFPSKINAETGERVIDEELKRRIEETYRHAYVNFSHWICMTDSISTDGCVGEKWE